MANLVPNVSFSSFYGLVPSPLRPSTPNDSERSTNRIRPSGSSSRLSSSDADEEVPLIRRSSHDTVTAYNQHFHDIDGEDIQPLVRRAPAQVQEAELQLSAECPHCSNQVVIKVPRYMMEVMGSGKARLEQELYAASTSGGAQLDAHRHWQDPPESTRDRVVRYSVRAATAFRNSRASRRIPYAIYPN